MQALCRSHSIAQARPGYSARYPTTEVRAQPQLGILATLWHSIYPDSLH
jgi:hypothetical protein